MNKINARNERIKREYVRYLEEARGRNVASRISCGEVQIVEGDQHGLGQVQRSVPGGRDGDHECRAIECVVRKAAVFPSEEQRDGPFPAFLQ